ncbi:MAG: DNA repair protein RecN [bacterium]
MLEELHIRNFALIDQISISFDPHLNILTGETGAGKTILINALNLLLGGRASTEFIRTGEESAEVEAAFRLDEGHPVRACLESAGCPCSPEDDLIIRRIIFRSEKANRCYVNGRMVPVSLLDTIGSWLVDIHGQHEHQLLLNTSRHLDILDRFGSLDGDAMQVSDSFHAYQASRTTWEELVRRREESAREREILAFQRKELESARLAPGEEEDLLGEQNILAHAVKIRELTSSLLNTLYQSEGSVTETLGDALGRFQSLCSLDPRFRPMEETLNGVLIQIEDITHQLTEYESKQDFSPDHLEWIQERLDLISKLKKKYQRSFEGLIELRNTMEERWELLENYEERIRTAEDAMHERWQDLRRHALDVSEKRRRVARRIERSIEAQLNDLDLGQARFVVSCSHPPIPEQVPPKNMTARGFDEVEFLFSANPGEDPLPLARIASGGEISRVMLGFKSCLAMADQVLTLVFDEIDTGIGGSAAVKVGRKMKDLASKRQIICITHLPQIASNASTHFLVSKRVERGRTLTEVTPLSTGERIRELAKMIAGDSRSETALRHASEILEKSGTTL